MTSKVDKHFAKKGVTKDKSNDRSVTADRGATKSLEIEPQSSFHGKQPQKMAQQSQDCPVQMVEQVAGAYYLPVQIPVKEAWEKIVDAMKAVEQLDLNSSPEEDEYSAFGLKYFRDSFMLARTKLCQVEGRGDQAFLELKKLEGDGFVFSDEFKKQLVANLEGVCEDIQETAPVQSEEAIEPKLQYLDFSDDASANDVITLWLNDLRPSGGVKYDQTRIFEALSALAWNGTDPDNFAVLSEYADDIVDPVLQILNHECTTYLPTVYFGALCLNKFIAGDALPEELKTWETAATLCSLMQRWCLENGGAEFASQQVTRSREVLRLLFDALNTLAPTLNSERSDKVTEVLSKTISLMPQMFTNDNSEAIAQLSKNCGL